MAEKLAALRARLDSIRQLRELVGAMRSLAAARVRQAEATLPAARDYAGVTAAALGDALALLPDGPAAPPAKMRAVIAICAEHGFVGSFSTCVLDQSAVSASDSLFVIGSHGVTLARERGLSVTWSRAKATQLGALVGTAHDLVEELYPRVAAGRLDAVDVVYTAHAGVQRRTLWPVDRQAVQRPRRPWPVARHLPVERLLERVLEEFVLAELVLALLESFASENAARLRTMQAAGQHVDETLAELALRERRARQDQVTDELLELAIGGGALATADE